MATVSKHGKGWRVQIRRQGLKPISKTFPRKGQAWKWAEQTEHDLFSGRYVEPAKHTLLDAFVRYARDVSPTKRGSRWEKLRLTALGRHPTASKPIAHITSDLLGLWRDDSLAGRHRRRAVANSTVAREMNLVESVLEIARREWKWIQTNPMKDVTKPTEPPPRRRRVPDAERRLLAPHLTGPSGREVYAGFELGIETGMRAGEMWSLERPQIDLPAYVAHLLKTKNGDTRDVSLSPKAVTIIRKLLSDGRTKLFSISPAVRDALFRKARIAAEIQDLHFHDSRAEAVWRLSKHFDVLELAEQIGHRDLKSLQLYYRDSASDRARKLRASHQRTPSPRVPSSAGSRSRRTA